MIREDRVITMSRLAILEKEYGKEIHKAEDRYSSDIIGAVLVKNCLRITAGFLVVLGIWAVCSIEFLLKLAADMKIREFLICLLAVYIMLLVVTAVLSLFGAFAYCRRAREKQQEYHRLLDRLALIDGDLPERGEE